MEEQEKQPELEDLIPQLESLVFGRGEVTPSISIELTPHEVKAVYGDLLELWKTATSGEPFGKRWIPYVEARLAYVRQFIEPEDVELIEDRECPAARLLHD